MFGYAAVAVGILLSVLLFATNSSNTRGDIRTPSGTLNPLRARARAVLREVVPSEEGDGRFDKLGWRSADHPGATSCGALPAWMGIHLGDPSGITRWGVPGARTEGETHHAWVLPGGGRRPKPGDIFCLARDPELTEIVHVGVLDEIDDDLWTTADSGQGPAGGPQRAAFVRRRYFPGANVLAREDNSGEPRYVAGWIDLDLWRFPPAHAASFAPTWRYTQNTPCDGSECQ